ncbi:MAG TPA: formate dehydrogenase subunit gamma [Burkholderiales bacterium]|nr:formate dehydrogenase subunit gamma [Burkholderiales bacterium]
MRRILLALGLAVSAAAAAQTSADNNAQQQQQRQATQPGNNAPVMREIKGGDSHYTSIPGREAGVLIQPPARFPGQANIATAGEAWRNFRNGPVTFYGGWILVLVLAAIVGFYAWKGPVKLHERPTGRLIRRFSRFEQVVHWSAAISFCVLGISGLIMLFGKHVLLPVIGYTLFAWLTSLGKNLHNFIAPLFIASVVVMIFMWLRDNLPRAYDWQWFAKAWAFFTRGAHIPSGRFNAGEKAWFWGGVILLSAFVAWSGAILLFPNFDQSRAVMQDAWSVHAIAALIYIAVSLGHIYMGTIGVEGAYGNMRHGYTDETWAKEHHSIWYEEVKSGRRPQAAGGAVPVGAPHMKEKP